jgi:hypothetical protein
MPTVYSSTAQRDQSSHSSQQSSCVNNIHESRSANGIVGLPTNLQGGFVPYTRTTGEEMSITQSRAQTHLRGHDARALLCDCRAATPRQHSSMIQRLSESGRQQCSPEPPQRRTFLDAHLQRSHMQLSLIALLTLSCLSLKVYAYLSPNLIVVLLHAVLQGSPLPHLMCSLRLRACIFLSLIQLLANWSSAHGLKLHWYNPYKILQSLP